MIRSLPRDRLVVHKSAEKTAGRVNRCTIELNRAEMTP